MNGKISLYQYLNENKKENMRFGDRSSIKCEDRVHEHMDCTNGECTIFVNVPFARDLRTAF